MDRRRLTPSRNYFQSRHGESRSAAVFKQLLVILVTARLYLPDTSFFAGSGSKGTASGSTAAATTTTSRDGDKRRSSRSCCCRHGRLPTHLGAAEATTTCVYVRECVPRRDPVFLEIRPGDRDSARRTDERTDGTDGRMNRSRARSREAPAMPPRNTRRMFAPTNARENVAPRERERERERQRYDLSFTDRAERVEISCILHDF